MRNLERLTLRSLKSASDREKLLGDKRERIQVATDVAVVRVIVVEDIFRYI